VDVEYTARSESVQHLYDVEMLVKGIEKLPSPYPCPRGNQADTPSRLCQKRSGFPRRQRASQLFEWEQIRQADVAHFKGAADDVTVR